MISAGNKTYVCSHCGWRIELVLDSPHTEWYHCEGNDSSMFPHCIDCGIQTRMEGAVHLPESNRFFKVIVFTCGPNSVHSQRLLNAYPVEITRNEYEALKPSRTEILTQLIDDLIITDSTSEANPFNLLLLAADMQSAEIDLSDLRDDARQAVIHMIEVFISRGLLHQVQFDKDKVSFAVDDDVREAYAKAILLKSSAVPAIQ
jgi:hypothetical protein